MVAVLRKTQTHEEEHDDIIVTPEKVTPETSPGASKSDLNDLNEKRDVQWDAEVPAFLDNNIEKKEYDWDSEEFRNIPEIVREVVGFEDDPSELVITFRSMFLSAIFCTLGSIISQLT